MVNKKGTPLSAKIKENHKKTKTYEERINGEYHGFFRRSLMTCFLFLPSERNDT